MYEFTKHNERVNKPLCKKGDIHTYLLVKCTEENGGALSTYSIYT